MKMAMRRSTIAKPLGNQGARAVLQFKRETVFRSERMAGPSYVAHPLQHRWRGTLPNTLAGTLPWGHHRVLFDRIKDGPLKEWYLRTAEKWPVDAVWRENIYRPSKNGRLISL
jgi:hypothetical protein